MTQLLAKLFARGNRVSDRFYVDRARPTLNARRLERERRKTADESHPRVTKTSGK